MVDDDVRNIFAMTALLERGQADVVAAESGADALDVLERMPDIDIILMDIMMPDMDGYETMRAIRGLDRFKSIAIIAVTGKATADERQRCIDSGANDYVPKPVDSAVLLEALSPWLQIPAKQRPSPSAPEGSLGGHTGRRPDRPRSKMTEESILRGQKILVVDDDARNVYAMTALLERSDARVIVADSGAVAIATLERTPDVDIVLMDIMMPVMDGYETIRAIRKIDRLKALPIIVVTGKAAPGERQSCIDAGANDYVPKPVDTAELIAALAPWLPVPTRAIA